MYPHIALVEVFTTINPQVLFNLFVPMTADLCRWDGIKDVLGIGGEIGIVAIAGVGDGGGGGWGINLVKIGGLVTNDIKGLVPSMMDHEVENGKGLIWFDRGKGLGLDVVVDRL